MKRIMSVLMAGILVLTAMSGCGAGTVTQQNGTADTEQVVTLTTEQKQEDLDQLCEEIFSRHPDPFFSCPEETFQAKKAAIESELSTLSDLEYYFRLAELVSLLNDGHVGIMPPEGKSLPGKYLPFQFQRFDDGVFIIGSDLEQEQWVGWKVEEMNGVPIGKVEKLLGTVLFCDGLEELDSLFTRYMRSTAYLKYLGIARGDGDVKLTLSREDITKTVAIEVKGIEEWELLRQFPGGVEITKEIDTYYFSKLIDGVLYIQYNVCMEDQLPAFMDKLAEHFVTGGIRGVIFDMRYNGGGNSSTFEPVYQALESYAQRAGITLECYTLIGGGTYSAGVDESLYQKLRSIPNSTIIGKNSGGLVNMYGNVRSFTLKNSGFQGRSGTTHWIQNPNYSGVLTPDIYVRDTFSDYAAGHDAAYELAVERIRQAS